VNGREGRRRSRATIALLVLGGWLVVSPLVLSTARVTAGMVSAVGGGVALVVLAGWARADRNPVPPLVIAMSFGLWLVVAPSLWEFRDGVESDPGLVPIPPSGVTEPTRAVVARAEWSSILAGPTILLLAGWALVAARRQARSAAATGGEDRAQLDGDRERR
jgi:hypothetical protein